MRPLWIIALAVAVLAGALAVFLLLRKRRPRARRQRPLRLKYPVVLAHGLMGFDVLELGSVQRSYFNGVAPRLAALGLTVHAFRVHPSATVAKRAEELAKAIASLGAKRVNIIAHSMGGLDARYLASRLSPGKVASVVTVGTPHRGTPLADLGSGLWLLAPAAKLLFEKTRLDVSGMFDLTTANMERFNRDVPDARGVFYGSWVGRAAGVASLFPMLVPTWTVLKARGGDNDGMVPVSSQHWGEHLGEVEADHWAQIGWAGTFDAPSFYEEVVRQLVQRGL